MNHEEVTRKLFEADEKRLLEVERKARKAAICECVTWLARNNNVYRSECLAGEMADDLLGKD